MYDVYHAWHCLKAIMHLYQAKWIQHFAHPVSQIPRVSIFIEARDSHEEISILGHQTTTLPEFHLVFSATIFNSVCDSVSLINEWGFTYLVAAQLVVQQLGMHQPTFILPTSYILSHHMPQFFSSQIMDMNTRLFTLPMTS